MTDSSNDLLTETNVLAAVCVLLVRTPGERPIVAEVAALFGQAERAFRDRWRRARSEPLGALIAYGCALRAAWLVSKGGEKCGSAARETGHARTWSLNRQLKKRLGVTLCECREELPDGFDWATLCKAYRDLDARTAELVEASA